MFVERAATFDVRDYLRKDMMPHTLSPGCGHGIALRALLWAVHDLSIDKDKLAVVFDKGCAGRLSNCIDADTATNGRPLAYAAELALAQPDLTVVVFTGAQVADACQRNLKLTCLVLKNEICATMGVSPTGPDSQPTTTTQGNSPLQVDACALATAAGAGFVGREVTRHVPKLKELIQAGIEHPGFAFIEIISDCPAIYGRNNKLGSASDMMMRHKSKLRPAAYRDTVDTPFRPNTLPTGILAGNEE